LSPFGQVFCVETDPNDCKVQKADGENVPNNLQTKVGENFD